MAVSIIGCLALLFIFILKNPHENNGSYYLEFMSLLLPNLLLFSLARWIWLQLAKTQLKNETVFFNVLLMGNAREASAFYSSFLTSKEHSGHRICAFLNTQDHQPGELPASVSRFTEPEKLDQLIENLSIEEVIITVDKNNRDLITRILQQLSDKEVNIKITTDMLDIITGALQTNNVFGVPLIDIHSGILPAWQQNIKRALDVLMAIIAITLLSPLMVYVWLRVRLSSSGPVIYRQERIGYKGKPFVMYKFRSMFTDAEKDGPRLSSHEDPRITSWGKTMRKWRLDELPQLWNVLKGEMSMVGPRPERKFYIDQIVARHPEYKYIFKVKPGITSWGMVNYGYASSIAEMIDRMPFDLLYVENVSLALDIKIMLYTLQLIFSGKGK